jgi:hypothetical protein
MPFFICEKISYFRIITVGTILRNFDFAKIYFCENRSNIFVANFSAKNVTPNSSCFRANNYLFLQKQQFFEAAARDCSYPTFIFAKTFGKQILSRKSAKISCHQNIVQIGPFVSHINDKFCIFVISLRKCHHLLIFRKLSYFSILFASNFCELAITLVSTLLQTQQCHYCYFPTNSK